MRSIRTVPKGEQIYNTYGNLPNSDLLRRYGYVIPDSRDDIVEIPCEMIVDTISSLSKGQVQRRIDILDEEGIFEEYSSQTIELIHIGPLRYHIRVKCRRRCVCFVWG